MINIEQISHSYGEEKILDNITWSLKPKGNYIITGPSGHGKSTLLKIIAKLIKPTSGRVTQTGKMKLGFLFQNNALFDSLTTYENVAFPLRELNIVPEEAIEERVIRYLKLVGLEDARAKSPSDLSGGMKKRLGIARALAISPDYMLYDEPTAGLDPITSRTISELILEQFESSTGGMVIVSSDLNRIKQFSGDIYLLGQKRFIHVGSFQDMKDHTDPLVKQFVSGSAHGPLEENHD